MITGSTDRRRNMKVSASTDARSAHCRSSIKITVGRPACSSPTTSSSRAPTANDETGELACAADPISWIPPIARSSWSTRPRSRSASAGSARAEATLGPAPSASASAPASAPAPAPASASARQRRARAVFPTPGSPSMATSHGWPAFTLAMTSATRARSAVRPTKTPSGGGCRSRTRPPRSRPHLQPPRAKGSVTRWCHGPPFRKRVIQPTIRRGGRLARCRRTGAPGRTN